MRVLKMCYSNSERISSTKKTSSPRNHQRAEMDGLKTAAKEEVKEEGSEGGKESGGPDEGK